MSERLTMVDRAKDYLEHRRALGFALDISGRLLMHFARFADRSGHRGPLTVDLALRWASLPEKASPRYRAERLSIVRVFARHLAARDGRSEVPDRRLMGKHHHRLQPHIYSDQQLQDLVHTAAKLKPTYRLRPLTYSTLFGLLASTGLRVSEALSMRRELVDLARGILRIEQTKFRKSRLVPLHATVVHAMRRYARERDHDRPARISGAFFVGEQGRALPYSTVRWTFRRLCSQLGWRSNGMLPRPAFTICVTALPADGCSAGTSKESMSIMRLRHSRPTWGTARSQTPTGILLARFRCSRQPMTASSGSRDTRQEVAMKKGNLPSRHSLLGPVLQRYFCQYLIGQRDLSPQTISAYRDTFKLLIRFLEQRWGVKADSLCATDLDAPCILAFLDDLERRRGNSARSRNARLAAIRSFIRHAASAEPLLLPMAQRLLAIPVKRFEHAAVEYLTREQMQSLLGAPDASTKTGLRDRVLLMLMYNTGARASEITALRVGDLHLESGGSVHIHGKGRKQRSRSLLSSPQDLLQRQRAPPPSSSSASTAKSSPSSPNMSCAASTTRMPITPR